jgi:hypothetical protein
MGAQNSQNFSGLFSIVLYLKKTRCFGNWICFRPQMKVGEKTPTQLGPLERANLNHWTSDCEICTTYTIVRILSSLSRRVLHSKTEWPTDRQSKHKPQTQIRQFIRRRIQKLNVELWSVNQRTTEAEEVTDS